MDRPPEREPFKFYSGQTHGPPPKPPAAPDPAPRKSLPSAVVAAAAFAVAAILVVVYLAVESVPVSDASARATAVALATTIGQVTPAVAGETLAPSPTPSAPRSPEEIVRAAMDDVARIKTNDGEGSAFLMQRRGADAIFVTNAHVVSGAMSVTVVTHDGVNRSGAVLARDTDHDLAVVAVKDVSGLAPLPMGNSDLLKVGDQLYVIGFPLGSTLSGDATVTRGILSGRRTVNGITYLQTDAAINPGNSGGPLLNSSGQVVGIATWRFDSAFVQGINFAIPSSLIEETSNRLLQSNPTDKPAQADVWLTISSRGAPRARGGQAEVWTGTEMIVWGGLTASGSVATGARYDPVTATWKPISTVGAPSPRMDPYVVWTGKEMIVWGGTRALTASTFLSDGARYNPASNTWTPLPKSPLSPRIGADAVWTGDEMIIWGGMGGSFSRPRILGDGARYNPATDRWTMLPSAGQPGPRIGDVMAWTGKEMVVWGGHGQVGPSGDLGDGARYNPKTNTWAPMSTVNALVPRWGSFAVWTGKNLIIWGGQASTRQYGDGAKYDPSTDSWTHISADNSPLPREGGQALWTGQDMIIWGGLDVTEQPMMSGGRYDPVADKWTPLPEFPLDPRMDVPAVWAGDQMIVWGGSVIEGTRDQAAFAFFDDGARFVPSPS